MGFGQVFEPFNLLMLILGVMVGVLVGALPGLNDSIAIAVLIPVTFGMNPQAAMCLLVGIYVSACYGGSIPAVLLKIPGTASSVVTAMDGYPMAQRGQAGMALSISTFSSVFGGVLSSLVLLLFSPILAAQALKFGPPEYFSLAVMGMSTVVAMAGKDGLKSVLSMALGLLISAVGMSPQTGVLRLTGSAHLIEGVPLIPMLIGLFGVSSIFRAVDLSDIKECIGEVKSVKVGILDREMRKRLLPTWGQSSLIGSLIGVVPGAGMIMAVYLAYDQAKRRNPRSDFGTGVPEGIAAPEAANNAVVASSMVPLVSLGIPGNSTSALFLGALMIQGLRPGPGLYRDCPEVAYLLVVSFLVANLIMLPVGIAFCNMLAIKILKLKRSVLNCLILILCVTGAFSVSNSVFNLWVVIVFSLLGYLMDKGGVPQAPLILATVLGSMMETSFLQSMVLSGGSLSIFLTRPISMVLTLVSVSFIALPILRGKFFARDVPNR